MSETHAFIGKLMLYETRALQQAYTAQTGLRQVSRAYCMTEIFENNFADFSDVVRVKESRFRSAVGGVSN